MPPYSIQLVPDQISPFFTQRSARPTTSAPDRSFPVRPEGLERGRPRASLLVANRSLFLSHTCRVDTMQP